MRKRFLMVLLTMALSPIFGSAACNGNSWRNNIPPRQQWGGNKGYCGEVSFISAGLYYGQYISQYDARAIATMNAPQDTKQLIIGKNDQYAATQMRLNVIEWNTDAQQNTDEFLAWVKQNVIKGYPVAIGIYVNEYLFEGNTDPNAGDSDYDHIVPVMGIDSNHCLNDPSYFGDDVLYFSDNGIWPKDTPTYNYNFGFDDFQASREEANEKDEPIYSITDDASNYGIAFTGVMDKNGDTLPVRLDTDINYEEPDIENGSSNRPEPTPIVLTITISDLQPGILYNLYRYNDFAMVPDSDFNANAHNAFQSWHIQIDSGSTYVMTQQINSDEMAIYRCVKASAP